MPISRHGDRRPRHLEAVEERADLGGRGRGVEVGALGRGPGQLLRRDGGRAAGKGDDQRANGAVHRHASGVRLASLYCKAAMRARALRTIGCSAGSASRHRLTNAR